MIIDARAGARGVLVDDVTGQRIPRACWANLETGEYVALRCDAAGRPTTTRYRGKTRLRWIPERRETRTPVDPPPLPVIVVPSIRCEYPGCGKLAEYKTADEERLEPQIVLGVGYERSRVVAMHRWCSWHYQPPKVVNTGIVHEEVVRP